MLYLLKTLIAAAIIVFATELSKRSSILASFLLALPIVSVTTFLWIWIETQDKAKIADMSSMTFWFVIPSLPMFLLLSWLIRHNVSFYLSLFLSCLLTAVLFGIIRYFQS